jgi:hypothetical protein
MGLPEPSRKTIKRLDRAACAFIRTAPLGEPWAIASGQAAAADRRRTDEPTGGAQVHRRPDQADSELACRRSRASTRSLHTRDRGTRWSTSALFHRDSPWPELLYYWGLPNIQVINRDAHLAKCATRSRKRSATAHSCFPRPRGRHASRSGRPVCPHTQQNPGPSACVRSR